MNANFARALAAVLRHEGGYSNHPEDNGGPTNKGVTLATYRRWMKPDGTVNDLKRITSDEVAKVYRAGFWNAVQGDALPGGLDYAVFDYAVNSGPGRAVKALQGVLGVAQDGIVGPVTLAAAKAADPIATINALCEQRMRFLQKLSDWPTFKNGWTSRVSDVRLDAIQLTSATPTQPAPAPEVPIPPPPDIPAPDPAPPTPAKPTAPFGWVATAILLALAIGSAVALYLWG